MSSAPCIVQAYEILDRAIAEFQPTHVFSLFSGGHDSWVMLNIAKTHPQFTAAVHINTGIGIPVEIIGERL
jgi:3'-phosphoadenosine 5'-phosphosulfate sulfotransferase (PAPS reductase)/FAD synthetase